MARAPEIQYACNDGVRLAWTQWGSGPDLFVVPGLISNVELSWEHEFSSRVLEWFGEHCRVTLFDKRGMGLSDRFDVAPTLRERVDDILAVMDAAQLDRPSLFGLSEGGLICQHFASEHPDRVDKLILANSVPGTQIWSDPDYREYLGDLDRYMTRLVDTWGTDPEYFLTRFAPSYLDNAGFVRWIGRFQRLSCTGADIARHLASMRGVDVYEDLARVSAPTLVLNCSGDQIIPSATGDALAERIPNSKRLILEGGTHFYWFGPDWLDSCIPMAEFITGTAIAPPLARCFAGVVFSDIVDSTRMSATHGDMRWAQLLDEHDRLAWDLCGRADGTVVKNTGDGVLARFSMPSRAVEFAAAFRAGLADLGVPIRVGVHAGEIELRHDGDITGVTVNMAARVEQAANDGAVFVSSTVRDMMLGDATDFSDRGEHHLKGFDGAWRLYEMVPTT